MDRISELEAQNEILKRRCEELEGRCVQAEVAAEKATVGAALKAAAIEAGFRPGAAEDVVGRAMREGVWRLDSLGKLLRVREDGHFDMTPQGDYVSATSWMRDLTKKLPGYTVDCEQQAAQSTGNDQNPWSAAAWNLTRQGEYISKEGIAAAQAAADAAGSPLYATRPPQPQQPSRTRVGG